MKLSSAFRHITTKTTIPKLIRQALTSNSSSTQNGLHGFRLLSSGTPVTTIKQALAEKIPPAREEIQRIRSMHGDKILSTTTVNQAYSGLRDVRSLTYETSQVYDRHEGIRLRGYTPAEIQRRLPKAPGSKHVLVEGMFWLLLTGDIPSDEQVASFRMELAERSRLPSSVARAIDALPTDMHPMTQYGVGILAMQPQSVMAREYERGCSKESYWEHYLEDVMSIVAQAPEVAARIYRRSFKDGTYTPSDMFHLDLGANLSRMLGFNDARMDDLVRFYLSIHTDHEGGSVSGHVSRIVGSALSDAFLTYGASMNGLAGPLHGLANQEVLRWLDELKERLDGREPSTELLEEYCWDTLNSGRVIPGYGQAVLLTTDPRHFLMRDFAQENMPDDEMFDLVSRLYEVIPKVLMQHGKVRNPWPNVDAHSGILLRHFGLKEPKFHTVMFALSRTLGPMSNVVWDRAMRYPLQRPRSVTTEWIKSVFDKEEMSDRAATA